MKRNPNSKDAHTFFRGPFLLVIALPALVFAEAPAPHPLSSGPYSFTEWPAEAEAGTYPPNMIFEQTAVPDPNLADEMDSFWVLPYDLDSRSRINGLGEDGFAFINTGNPQENSGAGFLGSAVLSLDTTGEEDIRVVWRGGTVLPNSRVYHIRLQYRIGDDGPFTDVLDGTNGPVEYARNETAGHSEVLGPVLLPAAAENEPLVQLRWKYYYTGVRLDPESGQRSKLRVGDILVTGGVETQDRELVFDDLHPAGQAGKPLIPFTVAVRYSDGTPDLSFSGDVTISLDDGPGGIEGTLSRTASGGTALFDDLVVQPHGEYRLRAEADGIDPVVSDPLKAAALTEIVMPSYIQGEQPENNDRVPFVYRARIDGLAPGATYRYGNRIEAQGEPADQDGAGNMIFVQQDGSPFTRNTDAPDFSSDQLNLRHGEFTTDVEGSYTGWFITEPTGNDRFEPGEILRMRILLNDGAGGVDHFFHLSTDSPVEIRSFGPAPQQASALYGEANLGPRNFIFLFDNDSGAGRPVSGTVIEGTGAEVDERYATFYTGQVAGRDEHWGTLIPNDLGAGILRVEERSLQTGETLAVTVADEPFANTVNAEHGPVPVYTDLADDPVFLPQGDGLWNTNANWSSAGFPDGPGERAIVHLISDNNREVSLGQDITIGRLDLINDTLSRNRMVGAGGSLGFDGGSTDARLLIGGSGSGFNELQVAEGVTFNSNLRVTVDNVNADGEFGALRIRESIAGPGGLIKEGFGVLSLTGGNKDYTGATVIDGGVLRVTESSVPAATSSITVNPGGQLRLVSHGSPRTYTFGGDLILNSLGPDESPVALPQAGRLGALRLDPELEIRESVEETHQGTITNNARFAGDSHIHVDGTANRLTLSGALSGTGTLLKSGGGTLVLSGSNELYEGGTYLTTGSIVVESGSGIGSGPLELIAKGGAGLELLLRNSLQTVSLLEGDLDDTSSILVSLAQGTTLDVNQDTDSRFQGTLAGIGSLLKRGDGILRLTRGPNTFLGSLTVGSGVLEITESSQPQFASNVSVDPGGQLRLTSTGERSYTLGSGAITLRGIGIDPDASSAKGALRQEGGNAADTATLTNTLVLTGDEAGVHANRDEGDGSRLILSGDISGDADLFKTGGGALVLEGGNADLTGGTVIENGTIVVQSGSRIGPGPLSFIDPHRERRVELLNSEQSVAGLSGDIEGEEGSLAIFLAEGHTLTVNQQTSGAFAGELSGAGNLVKTGDSLLALSGMSMITGSVAVNEGALRVDGSIAAAEFVVIASGASLEGIGDAPGLRGAGTVAPGRGIPGILDAGTFDPGDGLGVAFVFTQTGSPDYSDKSESGNDVLRLSGESAISSDLDSANSVRIFLDVPALAGGDMFSGGFFTGTAEGLAGRIENADFQFFLRDPEGATFHRGTAYRPYTGPLTAEVDTIEENGGHVMRIAWVETVGFLNWIEEHFPDPDEQNDPEITGPGADPDGDGVKNLLEYALGGDPRLPATGILPTIERDGATSAITFRRNPALTDIAYIVQASDDLEDWSEVLYDSQIDTQPNNLGNLMRIEDAGAGQRRFLRLEIQLLE